MPNTSRKRKQSYQNFWGNSIKRCYFDKKLLIYTDIQLKSLMRSIEDFNMNIIMRRESVIFYSKITDSATPRGGAFLIKIKYFNQEIVLEKTLVAEGIEAVCTNASSVSA